MFISSFSLFSLGMDDGRIGIVLTFWQPNRNNDNLLLFNEDKHG